MNSQDADYESSTPNGTEDNIEDEAVTDESVIPLRYDISSFGIDFDVEGLVRRLNSKDIIVPDWQRRFVWTAKQASSFVESLLLGLPVPGVFLGKDPETGQFYVIDGQQRLKTLQFFYDGKFIKGGGSKLFNLEGTDARFEGLSIEDLNEKDRRELNNSLIHATVVRQDAPPDNDTSLYQIFRRLNTGGSKVNPQEIRCAIYQGKLIERIKVLNDSTAWRDILGKPSQRLKDQELILRFLALLNDGNLYRKPMVEFLNAFTQRNRNPEIQWLDEMSQLFNKTMDTFRKAKGKPFRLQNSRTVNAAVFDSMAVGLANRISSSGVPCTGEVADTHDRLIENEGYCQAVIQGTSDESSVEKRLKIANGAFGQCTIAT